MKFKSFLTVAILTLSAAFGANAQDKDGHVLTSLWKDYMSFVDSDRPKKQLEVLEQIKKEAMSKRLAWDYYDAAAKAVDVRARINWKDRSVAKDEFKAGVESFDEPILTFWYSMNQDCQNEGYYAEFAKNNRKRLEKGHNKQFYEGYLRRGNTPYNVVADVLLECIDNDYEFVLWCVSAVTPSYKVTSVFPGRDLLAEYIGNDYPEIAILDYLYVKRDNALAREFVEKYKGKGAALLGEAVLLDGRFNELYYNYKTPESEFKAFREECVAFEKRRAKLSGVDARLLANLDTVEHLVETMDDKRMEVRMTDGLVKIYGRNIDRVRLSVEYPERSKDGKGTVCSATVDNPNIRYCVYDTLEYRLPAFSDGKYVIKAKMAGIEDEHSDTFEKYSISVVWRQDSKNLSIYAADYLTGKPVEKADIIVRDVKNDKETNRLEGFRMNGFTALPAGLVTERSYVQLKYVDKDGMIHLSNTLYYYYERWTESAYYSQQNNYAKVLVDRAAFNPDETLQYKVIAYSGNPYGQLKILPDGQKIQVILLGPENEKIEEKTLKVNEFGSAAGSFHLPRQSRNGMFSIEVLIDGKMAGYQSVRVDDFVLPNFDLTFDDDNTIYVSGDTVNVRGVVKAYSGHSLANAKVTFSTSGLEDEQSGDVKLEEDGRFQICLPADKVRSWDWSFNVNVKVVDSTGETKEFSVNKCVFTSIPGSIRLMNHAECSCELPDEQSGNVQMFEGNVAELSFNVSNYSGTFETGTNGPIEVNYNVLDSSDKIVLSGIAGVNTNTGLDFSTLPAGLYTVKADFSVLDSKGNSVSRKSSLNILKVSKEDKVLNYSLENLFIPYQEGNRFGLRFGASAGEVWACVEIVGEGPAVLDSRLVHLDGKAGKEGSILDLDWEFRADWGDAVTLKVIYFRNTRQYSYNREYRRENSRNNVLPFEFTRFLDMTGPAGKYDFRFKTSPDAECAVTVFEKSTETIHPNRWQRTALNVKPAPNIGYSSEIGTYRAYLYSGDVLFETVAFRSTKAMANGIGSADDDEFVNLEDESNIGVEIQNYVEEVAEEEAIPFQLAEAPASLKDVRIRENFANTLAFEPFLYPDKSGEVTVPVETSDKLSTYYFQVYAHDKSMNNSTVRQEFKVTVPVKLSVVQPQYLYTGDRYVLKASLSSNAAEQVDGKIYCQIYDRGNYKETEAVKTLCLPVSVAANGGAAAEFETDVPEGVDSLGFKVTFVPDSAESPYSDAVFVAVPVYMNWQTLMEAHSAILLDGMSRDDLLAELRGRFVNTSAYGAEHTEKSILDMVKDAIPSLRTPGSDNVLALVDALYANAMSASLGMGDSALEQTALMERFLKCRNSDGGFGWFEGMDSSPVITAVILERFDGLRRRGLVSALGDLSFLDDAVKYLDSSYFSAKSRPFWCGGLSLEQYLSVRSLYTSVPISAKVKASAKKDIKSYLTPKKQRGLNGRILMKARRVRILRNISVSADGLALAKAWGLGGNVKKLTKSLAADVASLEEYAVKHPEAGIYFPNAVMPFRGLMESELYAHSYLCDLFRDLGNTEIADGIRIWIMLQKETQQWADDPAYVDAIASVMDGSPAALDTRVIILSKSYRKPFTEIKAAGNGFTLAREYRLEGSETALKDGDTLNVGDKIIASYKIWNAENRSFIKLSVPRYACLRPVDQLSGRYGWWLRPLRVSGWYSFSPQGYRSVLADRTEYWFDAYPEENTVITETFYVTQSGTFTTPVAEIESLYAPHYRAVAGYDGLVNTR